MNRLVLLFLLPVVFFISGCSADFSPNFSPNPDVVAGQPFSVSTFGGRQPVAGAHVYMLAVDTTGYNHASDSLLLPYSGSSSKTTLDTSGGPTNGYYYITTSATGGLDVVSAEYNCTVGQAVYLYALGGNPGNPLTNPSGGANTAAAMMTMLGICEAGGNFSAIGANGVSITEISTVAAAYAMAGFATDAVHISASNTALGIAGVTNAANNAANLYNISGGSLAVANAKTASNSGTVPQAMINTLANILASCVNSSGPTSVTCAPLLNNAKSRGATGTVPTDTATAAINIAHNPGNATIVLFALQNTVVPWLPDLALPPTDFTLAINYTDPSLATPYGIAIDDAGSAWVTNFNLDGGAPPVTVISPAGTVSTHGASNMNVEGPQGIAIDNSGNAWFADASFNVFELSSSGSYVGSDAGYTSANGYNDAAPISIAIDPSGDAWTASGNGPVVEFSSGGVDLTGGNGFAMPRQTGANSVTIDTGGNAFFANDSATGGVFEFTPGGSRVNSTAYGPSLAQKDTLAVATGPGNTIWAVNGTNNVTELNDAGTVISTGPLGVYSGGGLSNGGAIAMDGAGDAWIANAGGIGVTEFNSAGTPLSGLTGLASSSGLLLGAKGIAVDGSGDVWVTSFSKDSVVELIGAATPVVTPIVASLVAPYSNAAAKP
jgi:hypothetical protein